MNIREISISRLKEYENNPRNNDLAVEKVRYSIERFGFLFPVIVDQNYVIVAGHTRVRACRELGIQSVPCIIADELTEEQVNFFRLVDNKTAEYSDWDFEKLKNELEMVDLTLEKNQLLLDRFELSAEVFDIQPEQAEIKIPSYNFMSASKPKNTAEKKPSVSTIITGRDEETTESIASAEDSTEYKSDETSTTVTMPAEPISSEVPVANTSTNTDIVTEENTEENTPKKQRAPVLIQFRFGDIQFFISQVELDRLNDKYAEYVDSGEMLKRSFADYLLEGVESND